MESGNAGRAVGGPSLLEGIGSTQSLQRRRDRKEEATSVSLVAARRSTRPLFGLGNGRRGAPHSGLLLCTAALVSGLSFSFPF